jgi:hypothetical protein
MLVGEDQQWNFAHVMPDLPGHPTWSIYDRNEPKVIELYLPLFQNPQDISYPQQPRLLTKGILEGYSMTGMEVLLGKHRQRVPASGIECVPY